MSRLSASHVDSAFYPPWDGKISTSQRAVMLCGWGVKPGMVWLAGKTVSSTSERIWGSYDDVLYKSTYTLLDTAPVFEILCRKTEKHRTETQTNGDKTLPLRLLLAWVKRCHDTLSRNIAECWHIFKNSFTIQLNINVVIKSSEKIPPHNEPDLVKYLTNFKLTVLLWVSTEPKDWQAD